MAGYDAIGAAPGRAVRQPTARRAWSSTLGRLRPSESTWNPAALGLLSLLLATTAYAIAQTRSDVRIQDVQRPLVTVKAPAQHAVSPARPADLRNPVAVERAQRFILSLQPDGSYVLTTPGGDDVVHMDVAHSAIALAKTGRLDEARSAMSWLLSKMTVPSDADRHRLVQRDGSWTPVDYSGSWWDHLTTDGQPKTSLTRGRAEGVGLALIAAHTIYQQDPEYLSAPVGEHTVADLVGFAARYLTSSQIQRRDGRFVHRPDYRVSFAEEGARMVLGLRLASEMLGGAGRGEDARRSAERAELGMQALLKETGLSKGMAYDHYALSIWGLIPPERARVELASLEAAGLATDDGVLNWDWQTATNPNPLRRLSFRLQALTVAPSESFDWAIASITAGRYDNALGVERRWLDLQRADGGFPGAYVPGTGLALGKPTSHSAARFLVLERLLTEVLDD